MVHDPGRGGQDDVAELTGRKELHDPLLHLGQTNVESWGNAPSLVQTPIELDDNLAGAVVVDLLEFTNVACWFDHLKLANCLLTSPSHIMAEFPNLVDTYFGQTE